MRPINLIISAFGPYAEEVKIEFDKFLDKGIYLISGNTGAGKSTIFEAIKFALYGEDNGEVRSKYAANDVPTFVEMTFTLHGQEYKVTRNPKYLRPKSRGEGSTLAKAEAELIYPDGRVVSGYANVTKEIIVLTGLNSEQFSKIVMIAQGKFRELLVADTASRSKIFRDIFKTEPYDKIQRRVKGKYLEACKENAKTNDSIKQFVQGIRFSEEYDGKIRLENILKQEIITDIDEVLELARNIIEMDEKAYESNSVLLAEKNSEIQVKGNKLVEEKSLLENVEALQKEMTNLKAYEEAFEKINETYERENGLKPEREQLFIEIENEKKIVEKYKVYEAINEKLSKANQGNLDFERELNKLIVELEELQKKLVESETKIQEKLELEKNLISVETSIRDNEEYIRKLGKINHCRGKLNDITKIYEDKLKVFKQKEEQCAKARDKYNRAFTMFIEAQAGVMAKELEANPNMPCPVCGSTNHVKLAKCIEEAPSEEEVDKLKEALDSATNEVMKASNEAGNANVSKENEKNNLIDAIKEVDNSWTVDNYYDNMCKILPQEEEKSLELKKTKADIEKKLALLSREIEAIPQMKDKLLNLQNSIKNKETEINNNKLEIKQLETNLDNIKKELKSDNEAEAIESLTKKEETYKKMIQSFEAATDAYNKHMTDKNQSKTIVEQLEKQLKSLEITKLTVDELENTRNDLKTSIDESDSKLEVLKQKRDSVIAINNEVYSRIQSNKQIVKDVDIQKQNLSKIISRLSGLKALSDTLNGEVEGKDKIKLETFVQISYFEQVILKANTKLFEMTEGQYEFIRDTSSEDKRTKSGLELSVYDHYNGTVRSVKTLSGGEGFMAALSLALGMADIIEESASGIAIDTMFIDEGFGSLDEEALEQAMKVLAKLSEGNKLVGIISHVSSLKDRIERQINVEKRMSGGSSVKVVL